MNASLTNRSTEPMPKTPPSQTRWKSENIVSVKADISRNQNPELYELFVNAASRGTLAREMLEYARKNMPELQNK